MTDGEILTQLNAILCDIFDDDTIKLTPATTADDIPDWDSFNHINIVAATETHFRIKFKTAEIEQLKNIGDLVAIIQHDLAAKHG